MPSTPIKFVPSGTPATFAPGFLPATYALPAVDSGNEDMLLQNGGSAPVWISFGSGVPVGPNAAGNVFLPGGASLLATANAAILTAGAADAAVICPQAGAWQAATALTAMAQAAGGSVTATRGTASASVQF